jgi:hypothetical protein
MSSSSTSTKNNVANPTCTEDKLAAFSLNHYTYINQIFGDMSVREIIHDSATAPQRKYSFSESKLTQGKHHFLSYGKKPKEEMVCSMKTGIQKMGTNYTKKQDKNDTLCQSYSLLFFFDHEIHKVDPTDSLEEEITIKKNRQLQMIRMYRTLIRDLTNPKKDFKSRLDFQILSIMRETHAEYSRVDLPDDKVPKIWMDYTQPPIKRGVYPYLNVELKKLFQNINRVLDDWEAFGYWYFIRKGTCPPYPEPKSKSATLKRKRSPDTTSSSSANKST